MRNDYKVICEKKYYAVFTDGQGKEQKIEISKEVAQVIQGEQTRENTIRRSEERHTVSFDAMDYEEIPRTMSWKDALQTFRYYKNLLNMKFKEVPTPVASVEEDDFE